MLNCILSDPKDFEGIAPTTEKDIWNYTKITCQGDLDFSTSTLPMYLEKIENSDNKNFFLQKTISYGDFLMIAFFIIFFVGFSIIAIRDFTKNRKLERL